jgi:hypothetical protein
MLCVLRFISSLFFVFVCVGRERAVGKQLVSVSRILDIPVITTEQCVVSPSGMPHFHGDGALGMRLCDCLFVGVVICVRVLDRRYPKAMGRTVSEIDLKGIEPAPFEKFKFSMYVGDEDRARHGCLCTLSSSCFPPHHVHVHLAG